MSAPMVRKSPGLLILLATLGLVSCAPAPPGPDRLLAMGAPQSRLFLDAAGPAQDAAVHHFGHPGRGQVTLAIESRATARMMMSLTCNGPARVLAPARGRDAAVLPAWASAGALLRVSLPPYRLSPRLLDLSSEVTRCDLTVTPSGAVPYTLILRRDPTLEALSTAARPLPRVAEAAATARAAAGVAVDDDALAEALLTSRALAMTPQAPAASLRLLSTGEAAFAARIEALTGSRVPFETLLAGDPEMPLDFTNAPRLEAIYLSYFYMNADFAGALMARMLAWHAARDTEIRILLSDTVIGAPERALFEGLSARYPNVQVQNYRFMPRRGDGLEDHVARLHRSNHAKIFLTLARNPAQSVAVIGGRNWHESYLFAEPRDLSAFPALRQYQPGRHRSMVDFLPFQDVELALSDPFIINAIARQFLGLWHRDLSLVRHPQPLHPYEMARPVMPAMRHFLSLPHVDGRALEALLVDLIDAARHRIEIASPFINPTDAVLAALERALERGVAVRLVTTMQMPGLDGIFITSLAYEFAQDWADRIEIVDFGRDPQALHAKLYVIDGRLALVGSVNLNRRSFYHDIENGVIVLDPGFARRVSAQITAFAQNGTQVDTATLAPRRVSLLMRMRWLRRAF